MQLHGLISAMGNRKAAVDEELKQGAQQVGLTMKTNKTKL